MHRFIIFSAFLLVVACDAPNSPTQRPSIQDRVISSGKIRCGYFDWDPLLKKDVNTQEYSGIAVDMMNEITQRLGITYEWVEEVGPATAVESIASLRVDMVCLPVIITHPRMRVADFSEPVLYSVFSVWVRSDSTLTDTVTLNDPAYKFTYIDGTAPMAMTKRLFPKAGSTSLTEMSPTSDMFLNVITRKADAVYSDSSNAGIFSKYNPNQIKPLRDPDTDRILPWAFMMSQNQYAFRRMIDLVLQDMHLDGTITNIINKHNAQTLYLPTQSRVNIDGF